jgi:hypothetical protein
LKIEVINKISADFDQDEKIDMAMIANIDSGGSGNFRHLFLLKNDGQNLIESDKVFLGDRIEIVGLKSKDSQISVRYLDRAQTDSFAIKPYIEKGKKFRIENMKLVSFL